MILDAIVAGRRARIAARAANHAAVLEDQARAAPAPRGFARALARTPGKKISAIAEFKRRSPSAGELRPGARPEVLVAAYAAAGASALSILTETPSFAGTLSDLQAARAAVSLPALRKDFLLDAIDVLESRAHGADAVLLIARILDDKMLVEMLGEARRLGMDALVEAHDYREVDRALAAGATDIGINHRDLDTLAINLESSTDARAWVGPNVTLVGESGIRTREDVARMIDASIDAILVGEHLMKSPDPGAALRELLR